MPVVDTVQTFNTGDTVTSTSLNNIMDQSVFVSGAVVANDGLVVSAGGQMTIENLKVTGAKIADGTIGTAKIADGTVTPAKLSAGGPSWDSVGGTLTLSSRAIELGNGITSNSASYIDFHSSFPIIDNDARIIRESGANGTLTISNIGTAPIVMSASGGVTFASANMPNPSGSAPIYGARAWVNFNGIGSVGANMTIRSQGNVSSVNKLGTGRYRVTFATAMPDANYATITGSDANSPHKIAGVTSQTSTYVDIAYSQINTSTARDDPDWGQVTIIR